MIVWMPSGDIGSQDYKKTYEITVHALAWPISSFEKHRPGRMPRCFSQKMAQKVLEKKLPSTVTNTMRCSLKVQEVVLHQ
jgi:hypothetical protein